MTTHKTTDTGKAPAKTNAHPDKNIADASKDKRVNEPVTELAEVEAKDDDKDLRDMAGISGKVEDASEVQQNVYHGMKDAKAHAKDPTKPINPHAEKHPHRAGPGSDIG